MVEKSFFPPVLVIRSKQLILYKERTSKVTSTTEGI